jgi:uncharacterized repeat protein (TIGR03847 family)
MIYKEPSRIVVGTVGAPGEREFFLQVREGSGVSSFKCEKGQVIALVAKLREIMKEIRKGYGHITSNPVFDDLALEMPLISEFTIGTMALSWNESERKLILQAEPVLFEGEELKLTRDESLEIFLSLEQAAGFILRCEKVIGAGRPACLFCSEPIDPSGHLCPRANGYRR